MLIMSTNYLLATFLFIFNIFNKSQTITAVTTRVVTAATSRVNIKMVKTKRKGTQYGNRNGGNQRWKPPTSNLTNVTFDYRTRMDTGAFKRNMSLITGKVAEKTKRGRKQIVKACTTSLAPVLTGPTEPGTNATAKKLSTYNYKYAKYLQEAGKWEENNSKLYIWFMQHCSPSIETKLQSMDEFEAV